MSRDSVKLVVFTLETENAVYEYGVCINQVQEITRKGKTMKLPGAEAFLEGIMNLRESIIPIIDLKRYCGLGTTIAKDSTRIVVVESGEQKCGIVVDDVVDIVSVDGENIEDPPTAAGGIKANFIAGLCKVDARLIIEMDIDKILSKNLCEKAV